MEFNSTGAEGTTGIVDLYVPPPASRKPGDITAAKESRQARCTRKLVVLLNEREDLRGVYAPADQIAEQLRWSA